MSFSQLSCCMYWFISPMSSSISITSDDFFAPVDFLAFFVTLARPLSLSASSSEPSFWTLDLARFLAAEVDCASPLVSRVVDLRPAFEAVLGLSTDFLPFFSFGCFDQYSAMRSLALLFGQYKSRPKVVRACLRTYPASFSSTQLLCSAVYPFQLTRYVKPYSTRNKHFFSMC